MKIQVRETVEVDISLDREEGEWLKHLLQNGPENEPVLDALKREELFRLLVSKGI